MYNEALTDIPSGTSWSNPVRIRAYRPDGSGPESVWLAPTWTDYVMYLAQYQQYIEIDGINMDGSRVGHGNIKIEGWAEGNPNHIRVMNADIVGKRDGAANNNTSQIILTASAPGIVGNNEFINLTIHGGGDHGEASYGFYIQSSGNLVEGCDIYDVSGAGIHIFNGYGFSADYNTIRSNTIRDISRSGDWRAWGVINASGSGNRI